VLAARECTDRVERQVHGKNRERDCDKLLRSALGAV
jgi:hypothetical protein